MIGRLLAVLKGLAVLLFLAGIYATLRAQEPPPIALTDVQQLRARVLQLDTENDALRRTVLTLQVQLTQCQQPTSQASREKAWTALEQTLGAGCTVDRATLKVACGPLPARPLLPPVPTRPTPSRR